MALSFCLLIGFLCLSPFHWMQCAYLEATNCQVESRYLGVLRKLQETKSLDPDQREAVQKMIEDALTGELHSVIKLSVDRYQNPCRFCHLCNKTMIIPVLCLQRS